MYVLNMILFCLSLTGPIDIATGAMNLPDLDACRAKAESLIAQFEPILIGQGYQIRGHRWSCDRVERPSA